MPSSEYSLKGGDLDLDVAPSYHDLKEFLAANGCTIAHEREGGIIECYVPTELIDHEEVPVKKEWASSLAEQMREIAETKGGTGQQTAINVALVKSQSLLKIVDGFHRDAAMTINNESERYVSISAMTWDELFDQRIFTAKDHAHVRFSRVVHWIRQVWQHSGVADKMSVETAILLYRYKTNGTRLSLEPDDVEIAKAWVARKEHQWGLAAMTIHSHLKVAEHVDPRLVHATREKKKGNALEAPTQSILVMFSDLLADRYDLQNAVIEAAMARNLKTAEIRALCGIVIDCPDYLSAQETIAEIDWKNLKPAYKKTKLGSLRRAYDTRHNGADVLSSAADNIASVLARARLSEERGEEITDDMVPAIEAAQDRARQLARHLGVLISKLDNLKSHAPIALEQQAKEPARPPAHPPLDSTVTVERAEGTRDETAIRTLIYAYVTGVSNELPSGYTRKDLVKVHSAILAAKGKISDWDKRFMSLAETVAGNPS